MLANRFPTLVPLLIGVATFLTSVDAWGQAFFQQHQLDASARMVSMDAAIAHQDIVLKALKTLQSEGYASPEEVAAADSTRSALVGEQELMRQMVESLNAITLIDPSANSETDIVMLPIPFVKDLCSGSSFSHVSYRLQTTNARQAVAKIQSLVAQLQLSDASAKYELMGQRLQRLTEINDQSAGGVREQELLKLQQAAFNAAAVFDRSGLPIFVSSGRQYRVGDETACTEEALIRRLAENTTRLRHATQLCQAQHQAELWEYKATLLHGLADSGATTQGELDYVRSGADFFRTHTDRLQELVADGRLLNSPQISVSHTTLQSEMQQRLRQHGEEIQQIKNECVALSDRVGKLSRLATQDAFFAGELAAVQRSLAVVQAKSAALTYRETLHAAAIAFVETQTSFVDATVMVSANTATATLRTMFDTDADNSYEIAVVNAQIAVAEVRVAALQELQRDGFAGWWEAASAEASLQDLRTELRRLNVVRQINALTLQIVEEGEPVFPHTQPLAMSR